MRIKRSLPIILGVVAIGAAVTLVVQLRKHAPPEPARLLPGADAFVYVNLKWVRTVNEVNQLPPVSHDPEYEQFIRETGFQFERDLDEAAVAVHYPEAGTPRESDGSPALRFSEVFRGRINGDKLSAYLTRISKSIDAYQNASIFNVPHDGRTVRVAIITVDTVAVSNHPDPSVIRGIVDRSRKLASPFGGPALLRQYYKQVPIASLFWAIARVKPGEEPSLNSILGSVAVLFNKPAVLVTSGRYIRPLHLKAEAFTSSAEDAQSVATKLDTFLNLFHGAETSVATPGSDPDVKAFFDSLKVATNRDHVVLTATVPPGFIRKALTEPPGLSMPSSSSEAQNPSPQPPAEGATPATHKQQRPQNRR